MAGEVEAVVGVPLGSSNQLSAEMESTARRRECSSGIVSNVSRIGWVVPAVMVR